MGSAPNVSKRSSFGMARIAVSSTTRVVASGDAVSVAVGEGVGAGVGVDAALSLGTRAGVGKGDAVCGVDGPGVGSAVGALGTPVPPAVEQPASRQMQRIDTRIVVRMAPVLLVRWSLQQRWHAPANLASAVGHDARETAGPPSLPAQDG